jgi:SynChlorMet cassette protein ScmC
MGGFLWRHAEHEAAFWTYMDAPWPNPPLFVLPWACLLQDIVAREGALVHAALVQNQGAGFLLAAPPGGGKTTASGRLPANWDLLADDAAFVWPDRAGGFLASPLPSWGYLTHGHPVPASLQRWRPAERIKLAGVCLLRKASLFQMSAVQPQEAVQEIYERFSEHPGVCEGRQTYAGQLFRAACSLARAVSAWQLELDMTCPYWENMESEILHYTY